MDEDRRNLLARIEIVSACIKGLEDPEKLLQVCGRAADARSAVATAFDVSDLGAEAILAMQVKRFAPGSIERTQEELLGYMQRLRALDGS